MRWSPVSWRFALRGSGRQYLPVSSTIGRNKLLIPGRWFPPSSTVRTLLRTTPRNGGRYATGGGNCRRRRPVPTIIVDSTVTCRMKRSDVIDNANIRPGDVIMDWPLTEKRLTKSIAECKEQPGLTSARHDVFGKYLAAKYPESYDNGRAPKSWYIRESWIWPMRWKTLMNTENWCSLYHFCRTPVVKKLLDALPRRNTRNGTAQAERKTKILHFVDKGTRGERQSFPCSSFIQNSEQKRNGLVKCWSIQHGTSPRVYSFARTRGSHRPFRSFIPHKLSDEWRQASRKNWSFKANSGEFRYWKMEQISQHPRNRNISKELPGVN